MCNYTGRKEELLNYLSQINPALPDEYNNAYRDAVGKYIEMRNDHLKDLLDLLADANSGNADNASRWKSVCNDALGHIEEPFHDQLDLVSRADGPNDLPALGGIAVKAVVEEKQFFTRLADVNSAAMRDRLVGNADELQKYTETLSEIWQQIISGVNDSNQGQTASYNEIVEISKKAVYQLADANRSQKEKAEKAGSKFLWFASKLTGPVATLLNLPVPDLVQATFDILTEYGSAYLDLWTDIHPQLLTRITNYRDAMAKETGGVLPVFKQCREQVYAYWNEKGTRVSSVWPDQGRSSFDDWKSHCATSAQGDDGDHFSADAYRRLMERWNCVKNVADDFERKWSGVFFGTLAPTTHDQLTDAPRWNQNSQALIDLNVVEIGNEFLRSCDEVYATNINEPLAQLKSAADNLLADEPKKQVKEAIQQIEEKIQTEIKDRIQTMNKRIGETLNWFAPDSIRKTFDRADLDNLIV